MHRLGNDAWGSVEWVVDVFQDECQNDIFADDILIENLSWSGCELKGAEIDEQRISFGVTLPMKVHRGRADKAGDEELAG